MPEPPATDEGWYVLHDLRAIDWDAWRDAYPGERETAIQEGREYLESAEAVEDAEAGASAVFSVVGHKADLLVLHLRPTLSALDALERRFEQTALAEFTEQPSSYVSVTEASGYTGAAAYFDPDDEADPGIRSYIESRLYPDLPDEGFVSFYPMNKRRDPEYNWYDLSFDERADLMEDHGEIGRSYGGRVSQIISGSIGFDDFEWGVTLFGDDPTAVKELLYEMRFDPSSSRYAEFGTFYSGDRIPPADLDALLAGDPVPTDHEETTETQIDPDVRAEFQRLDVEVFDGGHAVLVYSDAEPSALRAEVDGLRGNFEHYDTHVDTTVVPDDSGSVVTSVWETESAANTALGFLEELTDVTSSQSGSLGAGAPTVDEEPTAETSADPASGDDGDTSHQASVDSAVAQTAGEHAETAGHSAVAQASAVDSHSGDDVDDAGETGGSKELSIRETLRDRGIYAGQPHGQDVYAMVVYADAPPQILESEVAELADGFDRYDTHVKTALYKTTADDASVVSIWETEEAAETASEYLEGLPASIESVEPAGGFGTMGMFYSVSEDYEEEFYEVFADVRQLLQEMDGHVGTDLYHNSQESTDMFIASRWESREDCMAFFRSDAFQETVDWGREVLTDRPRHVFLA
jgi:chlorite dismutase